MADADLPAFTASRPGAISAVPWCRYLDALLVDQPLTGGLEPMLVSASACAHGRGIPIATWPGLLDD